jgi:uncharacterized protein with HEPN domain
MTKGDVLFLGHMLKAIDRITALTDRTDFRSFEEDWIVQNAVMRELEILGEAAGRLSRTLTSQHSDIPWRQITGLRHKLIHDYFEVDIDVVWTTATVNVPSVAPKLRKLAERLGGLG